jgi:hypothetical protein
MRVRGLSLKDEIEMRIRCWMPHPHPGVYGIECGGLLSEWPIQLRELAEGEEAADVITCDRCGARYVEVDE